VRLLLLGPPGAGKGTQGTRLAETLGLPHIATGDIIRDHIARGTEFGRKIEQGIAAGNFAPDGDIIYWVDRRLDEPDARDGYILDGFPRDLAQAQIFDAQSDGRALDCVAELTIREDALVSRLAGRLVCPHCDRVYHVQFCPPKQPGLCDFDGTELVRRPDDEPAAIHHRFDVYESVTLPLRQYYDAQGILHSVDAEGDPVDVNRRLRAVIRPFASGLKNARLGV
jgi:adenylate kinase